MLPPRVFQCHTSQQTCSVCLIITATSPHTHSCSWISTMQEKLASLEEETSSAAARPLKHGATAEPLLMLQHHCFSGLLIGCFVATQSGAACLWTYKTHHPACKLHNRLVTFERDRLNICSIIFLWPLCSWALLQMALWSNSVFGNHQLATVCCDSVFTRTPSSSFPPPSSLPLRCLGGQQFPVCFKVYIHRYTCVCVCVRVSVFRHVCNVGNVRANKRSEGTNRDALWKDALAAVCVPLRLRGRECIKA